MTTAPQVDENGHFSMVFDIQRPGKWQQETFTNDRLSVSSAFGKPLDDDLCGASKWLVTLKIALPVDLRDD
jgi:hypothetical protein